MTPSLGPVSGDAGERVLLERDRALATIARAVAQAQRGRARVVVVSGPSGSGRSALLDEVCDSLGPPWAVRSTAPPPGPSAGGPVVVLADDADDLPVAALAEVTAGLGDGRVALAIVAVRAGPAAGPVADLVGAAGAVTVDLHALSPAAVGALCAAAGDTMSAVAVHRRTAGLPALVTALIHDPLVAVPSVAAHHVRRALAPLGDGPRALVELLAVAPGPVPSGVAECGSSASDVGALREARLVRERDGAVALEPPLLGEVLRTQLSTRRQSERRRHLARCWMLAPEPCAATIAALLALAGDRLAARAFFLQAGDVASRRGDPAGAVELYLEAQRAGPDLDPGHLQRAACAAASVGRPGLAERWAGQAEAHLRASGDGESAARVWQHPELAYVRRSVASAELPAGSPGQLAAEAEVAARRWVPRADVLARSALDAALDAEDTAATGTAAVALLLAGLAEESRCIHDELRDRAVRAGDHLAEAAQLRALSRVALSVGDPLAALLHARAAVAAAERGPGTVPAAFQRIHLGAVLTITGDLDEAAAITEPLVGDPDPTVAAIAAIPLAGIDLARGQPSSALQRLAPLLPHREAAGPDAFSGVLLQVAEAHVQQHDHDRARAVLADIDAWVGGRLEPTRPDRLALAARIAAREGDGPVLRRLAAEADAMLAQPAPAVVAVVELLRGLALRGRDDHAATDHLRAAALAAARAPRAGLAITAWLDAGDAALAAGRRTEAVAALDEARHLADGRGIRAEDDRIAALGSATATGTGLDGVHLTPRERSLLGLLTEGCTNRQMADRLHLSDKTVRNQLSTLFAKLGVERRSQAAVLAMQHGIEAPVA